MRKVLGRGPGGLGVMYVILFLYTKTETSREKITKLAD
jgi:hypothetical protein